MVRLYAVVVRDYSVASIEFYWAENATEAEYKAVDAFPTSRYGPTTLVPFVEPREEAPNE